MSSSILVVAGEASGDRHAARLLGMIHRMKSDVTAWGIGGELLRREGMEILADAATMNVVGFVEVLKRYRYFRSVFNFVLEQARLRRPALAILVDYPGFNLRMARALHEIDIPVVYYIAPQVWAWKEGRVEQLRRYVDDLIVAFPFEVEYFRKHGIKARFFGHPLVDQILNAERGIPSSEFRIQNSELPRIAWLPGSRPEEIARHMPVLCEAMRRMGPGYRNVIPLATTIPRALIEPYAAGGLFEIVDSSHDALRGARAAIVKSGTSTVDATLLGVPFAVIYKTSTLSYHIARRMIKVPHIAMTNVLAGRAVVREFVQDDVDAGAIAAELERLVADGPYREQVLTDLAAVSASLGEPGAAERVAKYIVDVHLK